MDELEVCRLSAEALGYRVSSYPTVGCWLLCNDIILPTPNDRSDVEANSTAYHQVVLWNPLTNAKQAVGGIHDS